MTKTARVARALAGLATGVVVMVVSANASFAARPLPVTVTGSTNWAVADALPPAGPSTMFTYGTKPLVPVMGDWDGDGDRTPGTFEAGRFKLSNTLPPGSPTIDVAFGDPRGFPVVGDWNGDGFDDVAVFRGGAWTFRVETRGIGSGGTVTNPVGFSFGTGSWPSTIPVAGDWDGDGIDGIGVYTYASGLWQLRHTPVPLGADLAPFTYWAESGSYPVVGDWNGDGTDSVGVTSGGLWHLNNENDAGPPDIPLFAFGTASDLPLVGGSTSDVPPTAVNDAATVAEDAAAAAVAVLANDTDPDGGAKAIASATDPANGTVVLTGGSPGAHTGLTYQPDPNYCNSPPGTTLDTFTYTLNGGSIATVSMTVTCVDDAPDAVNDSATLAANASATAVDVLANDTDIDGGTKRLASATDPANGTVVLTGGSPGAHTGLTYQPDPGYCNSPPGTSPDTFSYTLTPGGSSATVSITVTCAADTPPTAVNDAATVAEDAAATAVPVLTNDTDPDGGPKTIASATDPANGTVVLTGGSPGAHTGLTYQPDPSYCNSPPGTSPDTFSYTLNGGSSATVSMTVTCVNDNPVVNTSAGSLAYTENDPATAIDPGVTVSDPDAGASITGATVAITTNFAAGDVLALNGIHMGISALFSANTLSLTGTATTAAYQAALRDVTYRNTSEGPSTLTRTVTFTVTDNTALSGSDTRGITVAGVNDPPTAVGDAGTTDEDTPLNVPAPGVLANDTDVDPGDTKTVVALNGSATLTGSTAEGGSVTINANGSYTYTPPSAFQSLSTGQSDTDSFGYTMRDAANAQSSATVNLTVNGVSDAPTAVADTFDAIGNTGLFVGTTRPATQAGKVITGSILANDTDPDSPQASLVAEPVTNAPTTLGGTITIEADGNFTYHPDDGDVGTTDTFAYRVCDASPCNSATVANATGTINLVLNGQVWYVRNNQTAGGDGTSDTPFDTLLEAETASGTGDAVYVFDGDNTTTNLNTGYVMQAGELLIGETRPLTLDPDGGGSLPAVSLHPGNGANVPTLSASNEDVVALAAGVTVDGFNLDPSGTGGGIAGGTGTGGAAAGDVTVARVDLVDTGTAGTQPGIELDGTTGVNRFTGVTVTTGGSATAIGVRLNSAASVLFADTATNTIATTGAKALDVAGTNLLNSRWNNIAVTGSGTGAIRLSNTTGSPDLGDGAGTDLSLQTTSGATAALDIASSNDVTVNTDGTDTISATGGPAVDIRNSNGSRYFFDSVSSTNSAGDGINLDTNLATPFVASAGAIGGAAGIAVDIEGGGASGNFIYNGAINDGTGQSVEVTGRDGGEVSIGSTIADSGDAGGGIVVSGNSGGLTAFASASKILNTGAADAVVLSSNGSPVTGHRVTFANGGLDIDTTSGRGLTASGGGLVEVTHFSNSITTGTGTALNVDNSGIGSNNVSFASISSNGSANGIRLNSTGTQGRLNVTGSGGTCTSAATCTGGAIQNSTTSGVSLTNVPGGVSLTRMAISASADDGVRGTDVGGTGFDLDNVWINGNGNALTTGGIHGDHGVDFTRLTGTSTFTNTTVSNSADSNVVVEGASGAMTLDVTGGTYSGAGGGMGDSIYVETNGAGAQNLNVQGPITFANNVGSHVQHNGNPTSTADSDVTVNNATMSSPVGGGAVLGGGITVVHGGPTTGGGSNTDATITNNNIQNSVIGAIVVGTTGSVSNQQIANVDATISNNTIGTAGVAGSGSVQGNGIFVDSNGNSNVRTLITNNLIRQWTNRSGIALDVLDGDAQMSATVKGNVLTEPNSAFAGTSTRGMTIQLGVAQAGDAVDVCLDIGDAANAALKNQVTGTGESPQPDVRYLHEGPGSIVQLVGYAGPAVPSITDIASWFQPRNNLSGTPSVTGTSTAPIAPASMTTGAASCPQPTG